MLLSKTVQNGNSVIEIELILDENLKSIKNRNVTLVN